MKRAASWVGVLACAVVISMLLVPAHAVATTGRTGESRPGYVGLVRDDLVPMLSNVVYETVLKNTDYAARHGISIEDIFAHQSGPMPFLQPPFSANKKISDASSGEQNEVSMAVDTGGNLAAGWNDNRPGHYECGYTTSQDMGTTWSTNFLYKEASFSNAGDPVTAADKAGNLYLLCMDFEPSLSKGDLEVTKSTDGGKTWGAWKVAIDQASSGGFTDKPWFAAGPNNVVYVTWTKFGNGEIMFIKSTDGGQTWTGMKQLSPGSGCQGSNVGVDNTGHIYISYWCGSNIYFIKSTDGGSSFSADKNLGNSGSGGSNPRSGPLTMLSLDTTGSTVAVAWSGQVSGSEDTWVATSTDSGNTWTAAKKVNDDTNNARQFQPSVSVDTNKNLHVEWSDLRNSGKHAVYYTNSTDGGVTFSPNIEVTDAQASTVSFMGDYKQLVMDDNNNLLHLAWCDSRNGDGDIYYASRSFGPPGPKLARIDVTPVWANITADQTQQFTATGYDTNGNKTNINPNWGTTGGSVSSTGLYTPGPIGTFTVYANQSGVSGTAKVTVSVGALASIDVTPKNPTITVEQTQQFAAAGKDSKGNNVVINSFNWTTNSGGVSSTGLYTPPTKPGSYTIWANASGKSGSTGITVTAGAPTKLTVSPKTATITADGTQQFMATAQDKYGNPVSVTPAWTASGGSISTAGLYTPKMVGTFTITASSGSISDTATIMVTPGNLAKIVVDPPFKSITADETAQFTATGTDANGNGITIAPAWATSGGSISTSGLYTPVRIGSFTVYANQSGVSGSAQIAVKVGALAMMTIDPTSATITVDQKQPFTAKGFDGKGNEIKITPSWSADSGSVNLTGVYTPDTVGQWKVTASKGSLSASADVTVTPGDLKKATITPNNATLKVGDTQTFIVKGFDSKNNELEPLNLAWSVTSDIGSIDQSGKFLASKAGKGKVMVQVGFGQKTIQLEATMTVKEPSFTEGLVKVFGGETNLWIFLILITVLVVALILAAVFYRRKKRWAEDYQSAMMQAPPPIGAEYQQPLPGQYPQPPLGQYQPPPPGQYPP